MAGAHISDLDPTTSLLTASFLTVSFLTVSFQDRSKREPGAGGHGHQASTMTENRAFVNPPIFLSRPVDRMARFLGFFYERNTVSGGSLTRK